MVIYNNLYRKLVIFYPCFPEARIFLFALLALSIRACSLFMATVAVLFYRFG